MFGKILAVVFVCAGATAGQNPSVPTLPVRVPLTIVDVTVTDAQGHPLHNLKQSDFTIFEDAREMKLASFEEHRSDQALPPEPPPVPLPPNTFTNATSAAARPSARPINILLIDNLNTPSQVQQRVQQQMLAY